MEANLEIARTELIIGGQKSGKSARAEKIARAWLQSHSSHRAKLIATAQAWDSEMAARIARHQADRTRDLPTMETIEEPLRVAEAMREHSEPTTLIVLDCLTLWLSNCLMPMDQQTVTPERLETAILDLLDAVQTVPGPIVIVSNEIGLGVIPMGRESRAYVDRLGQLNQAMATVVERVNLMVAGIPITVKDQRRG